jgi:hypothetical protein
VLVGHFAMGFFGKRVEPRLSLGTLILAAMLPDLLWPVFTVAGLERVKFGSGLGAGNYLEAVDIAMSHSLLMGAVWAAILGLTYIWMGRSLRGACVLIVVVLSHWLLDVVSHRPDMPLAPAMSLRLGLGLWTSIPATVLVEGGLWLTAIVVYARATEARTRAGVYAYWSVLPLLTLIWYNNIAGPAPDNAASAPVASFVLFSLVVLWAYWMNRLRSWRSGRLANTALEPSAL